MDLYCEFTSKPVKALARDEVDDAAGGIGAVNDRGAVLEDFGTREARSTDVRRVQIGAPGRSAGISVLSDPRLRRLYVTEPVSVGPPK